MTNYIDAITPSSSQQGVIALNKIYGALIDQTTALEAAMAGVAAKVVAGTAQASTSGSTLDFTDIPSWVKKVTCLFAGLSLSGTDHVLIQIGDSGGVETSGYVSTSTIVTAAAATAAANSTAGFIAYDGAAANTLSGAIVLYNVTGNQWVASGTWNYDNGTTVTGSTGGSKSLSATLDRVRFTVTGANTFDAGTVNILYE
jgi:hypothetical protein